MDDSEKIWITIKNSKEIKIRNLLITETKANLYRKKVYIT